MREIEIKSNDAGQRLNKFLMKYMGVAPASFIYKMIRKKNIVLNGSKAKGDEILSSGDLVKLFLSDETIDKFISVPKKTITNAADVQLDVLYRNQDIMAVHKPSGVLSQQTKRDDYTINEMIVDYCLNNQIISEEELRTFSPSICNRLDRNTSGIILAGISLKGSQELSRLLRDREADKYYFTIVKGAMMEKQKLSAYICKDESINKSQVISKNEYDKLIKREDYQKIENLFEPISCSGEYTFLRVKLITGKSHQIRAHLSSIGYFVVGDNKYGDVAINRYFRDKFRLKNHILHSGVVIITSVGRIVDELPDIIKNICRDKGLDTSEWLRGIPED